MQKQNGRTEKNSSFVKQAGILAAAGIISRIIGLLYRSPLTGIIGDEGNGYYSFAYNIYTIILLIASYSIPSAISKVMAQKMAYGEYRDAQKILKCAFVYVCVVGGAAAVFAYFAAPHLVVANAVPVLRIFAPTIFLSGLLGVLRGYFQAHRTMVPTSTSQILEQCVNASVSIGAAWFFIHHTDMIRFAPAGTEEETAAFISGACGSALGTGAGVLTALIFMTILFIRDGNTRDAEYRMDRIHKESTFREMNRNLLMVVTPFIISTFIYNFSTSLNQTVYSKFMMEVRGLTQESAAHLYGVFSGKAVVIANIPIAFSSAMAAAVIPSIATAFAKKDRKTTLHRISLATKVTMLIAIPCSVGLFVLSRPVMQLLFPQKASLDMASAILRALSITVVFYSLSTLSNAVLQSVGKVNSPMFHAAISLVVQALILVGGLCLFGEENSVYSLVLAQMAYSLMMCILNELAVRKYLHFRQRPQRVFILPFIASFAMGAVAFALYHLVELAVPSNLLGLVISIPLSGLLYFALIIKTHAVTAAQLQQIPKGDVVLKFAKKLRLL